MAQTSPEQLAGRLRLDYAAAMSISGDLIEISAHRSLADAESGASAITSENDAHFARFYRVLYNVKTLGGPGKYVDSTTVVIDSLAGGNYPLTPPACWVRSAQIPWSPHFRQGSVICLGELWTDSKGDILLAHLLIHIAKLLNFDEVARGGGYVGWNREATEYWENKLGGRPLQALMYPVPDPLLTHATERTPAPFGQWRPTTKPTAPFGGRSAA